MRRTVVLGAAAVLIAGCGGSSQRSYRPPAPRLPHALAQSWSRQATEVADALAANDGCAAEQRAARLRTEVIAAINGGRVPRAFLEPLTSAVNALPERITCTRPASPPKPPKPGRHGRGHGHGNDQGGGHD